jgi:hypothetical protein
MTLALVAPSQDAGAPKKIVFENLPPEKWTSAAGTSLNASLTMVSDTKITLKSGERIVVLEKSQLSDASRKRLEELISQHAAPNADPSAAPKKLNFLGTEINGKHIVVCIDVSPSFYLRATGKPLDDIRDAILALVQNAPPDTRLNIIFFRYFAEKFQTSAALMDTKNKNLILQHAEHYLASDGGPRSQRTESEPGSGVDSDGVPLVIVGPQDFPETKRTGASSRVDLGLLAALSEKPEVIILIGDKFPEVGFTPEKGEPEKLGNRKVHAYLEAAYKNATKDGHKIAIHAFLPPQPDPKQMTEGQKYARTAYQKMAALGGGKAVILKSDQEK